MQLIEDFQKAQHAVSLAIHEDIREKIRLADLCIENVGLACRYRFTVFDNNPRGFHEYVQCTILDAKRFADDVGKNIFFEGTFNHSERKMKNLQESVSLHSNFVGAMFACADGVDEYNKHHQSSKTFPPYFDRVRDCSDAKGQMAGNTLRILSGVVALAGTMEERLKQSENLMDIYGRAQIEAHLEAKPIPPAEVVKDYLLLCQSALKQTRGFVTQLQFAGFR